MIPIQHIKDKTVEELVRDREFRRAMAEILRDEMRALEAEEQREKAQEVRA